MRKVIYPEESIYPQEGDITLYEGNHGKGSGEIKE